MRELVRRELSLVLMFDDHALKKGCGTPLSPTFTYMQLESLLNKRKKTAKMVCFQFYNLTFYFLFSYLAIKIIFSSLWCLQKMLRLHPITMQCQDYCKSDPRCREENNLWRICCFHRRSCKQTGCQHKFEILVCRLRCIAASLSSISFRINCRCHFKSNCRSFERKGRGSQRKCI